MDALAQECLRALPLLATSVSRAFLQVLPLRKAGESTGPSWGNFKGGLLPTHSRGASCLSEGRWEGGPAQVSLQEVGQEDRFGGQAELGCRIRPQWRALRGQSLARPPAHLCMAIHVLRGQADLQPSLQRLHGEPYRLQGALQHLSLVRIRGLAESHRERLQPKGEGKPVSPGPQPRPQGHSAREDQSPLLPVSPRSSSQLPPEQAGWEQGV